MPPPIPSGRKRDPRPRLRSVPRLVKSPVTVVADAPVFRSSGHYQVEDSVTRTSESPCEGFPLSNASVLQAPRRAPVATLVHPPAERRDVEHACLRRTGGIEQDVSGGGFLHTRVGFLPGSTAVVAAAH